MWSYDGNENEEEFCVRVPLADGNFAHINHLGIHELTKTLSSIHALWDVTRGTSSTCSLKVQTGGS